MRSGLVETVHHGTVAVVARDGSLVASHGDIDRPFFIRSSAKPFQATIAQEAGANLDTLEMAVACASHRGYPVHVALVSSMLSRAGLDESALQCPFDWPLGPGARDLIIRGGAKEKRRIWHNCSGKHAAFLRACVASGWPIDSYLDPEHPLQQRVIEFVSELGDYPVQPVGVDGCGAPVLRTTARVMARLFARLSTSDGLDSAFGAMHQYPALVAANGEGDTEIAIATQSAAKGGAAGCLGVATDRGYGLAVKSWDGSGSVANLAAVSALQQLDALTPTAGSALERFLRPPVLGGGRPVGNLEPQVELEFA
ncbi:MAG: asparaginase [Actinomycetota bacterium]